MTTVAIQGIAGSFHEQAAHELRGTSITIKPCLSFADVFAAVHAGKASHGVVAVENSLHGSINAVYRLLDRHRAWVSGETFLKIEQYLIAAQPTANLTTINRIRSQAPAIAQCELWLEKHLPNAIIEETTDTAGSVRDAVEATNPQVAAIASKRAAELYNASIIAGPINDDRYNFTRFFLLTANQVNIKDANKTSIILRTNHAAGALQRALELFAAKDINLSKLDSHPIPGDVWHYAFYIDYEAAADSAASQQILSALKEQGCSVTVLGSYIGASLPH